MENLRKARELVRLSQIALARRAGVSRMRLQLAEAGEIVLRPDEVAVLNRALRDVLVERTARVEDALAIAGA